MEQIRTWWKKEVSDTNSVFFMEDLITQNISSGNEINLPDVCTTEKRLVKYEGDKTYIFYFEK